MRITRSPRSWPRRGAVGAAMGLAAVLASAAPSASETPPGSAPPASAPPSIPATAPPPAHEQSSDVAARAVTTDGRFSTTPLSESFPGASYSAAVATATNDAGQVAGSLYIERPGRPAEYRGVLWSGGDRIDMGPIAGWTDSITSMNEAGWVTGVDVISSGPQQAFIWHPFFGRVGLGTFGGPDHTAYPQPMDINEDGLVVGTAGYSWSGQWRSTAFLWDAERGIRPIRPLGHPNTQAEAVDEAGRIGGGTDFASTAGVRASRWTPGGVGFEYLPEFPVPTGPYPHHLNWVYVTDMNERGDAVGLYSTFTGYGDGWHEYRGFRWTDETGMVDLVGFGGELTFPHAINEAGQVVGESEVGELPGYLDWGPVHAFVWDDLRGMIDLSTHADATSTAYDIDDHGRIVGREDAPGVDGAVVWNFLPAFRDVGAVHPFVGEIGWAADEGIASGYPDGTFRPTRSVERQAVAAFLHRLSGAPAPTLTEPYFADVSPSHPFYEAIQWMAEQGIATGTPHPGGKPTFDSLEPVSRAALAAFLHRLAGQPAPTLTEPFFADVGPTNPFYTAVQWMAEADLSTGTPALPGKPRFEPWADVERQAVAAFLFRYDRLP